MTDVSDMPTKEDAARAIRAAVEVLNMAIRNGAALGVVTNLTQHHDAVVSRTGPIPYLNVATWAHI
jgi:hypothetical protein